MDHAAAAQKAAEDHLDACYEAMSEYDNRLARTPFDDIPDPSVAPFCGCSTCVVREVLHAAYPHLLELAREEVAAPAEPRRDETTTGVDTMSIYELDEIQLLPGSPQAQEIGCTCPDYAHACPLHRGTT